MTALIPNAIVVIFAKSECISIIGLSPIKPSATSPVINANCAPIRQATSSTVLIRCHGELISFLGVHTSISAYNTKNAMGKCTNNGWIFISIDDE